MKRELAATFLAIAFLSAGAFANNESAPGKLAGATSNQTVIAKNQACPLRQMMTVEPCAISMCVNI